MPTKSDRGHGYDKAKVAAAMKKHGRLAQMEADPKLQRMAREAFAKLGVAPDKGLTAWGTLVEWFRTADPDTLNAERTGLYQKRLTRDEVMAGLAKKMPGLGKEEDVRKMAEVVRSADMRDGLLERRLRHDYQKRPEPLPDISEREKRHVRDESSRSKLMDKLRAEYVREQPPEREPLPRGASWREAMEAAWENQQSEGREANETPAEAAPSPAPETSSGNHQASEEA
jgi:hypothetical protein